MITSGVWQGLPFAAELRLQLTRRSNPNSRQPAPTLRPRCPNERQVWGGGGGMPYGGNGVECRKAAIASTQLETRPSGYGPTIALGNHFPPPEGSVRGQWRLWGGKGTDGLWRDDLNVAAQASS